MGTYWNVIWRFPHSDNSNGKEHGKSYGNCCYRGVDRDNGLGTNTVPILWFPILCRVLQMDPANDIGNFSVRSLRGKCIVS